MTDPQGRQIDAADSGGTARTSKSERKNHVIRKAIRGESCTTEELALLTGRTQRSIQKAEQRARALERRRERRLTLHERAVIFARYLIDPDFTGDLEDAANLVRDLADA